LVREPYLLAAGLLTGLAISASTLPQLSIIQPGNYQLLWDAKKDLQPTVGDKIIPSVEIPLPEFSNEMLQASQGLQLSQEISLPEFSNRPLPAPLDSQSSQEVSLPESNQLLQPPIESLHTSYQPNNRLISGTQLYYERLTALKTGKIYTRLDNDRLQAMWASAAKRQLSYEDWKALLALEAKAIALGQGANRLSIIVGDSLSMWFPKEKLPPGKLWLNQGISGDTSGGVLKRLSYFSETRPDVIYVMAGINDLRKGANDVAILRNHRRILRSLRSSHPQTQIIVQSILPTRLPKISNNRIRHLNAQIASIAKAEGANYLNIHPWFADFQGNLREDLTTDGLHLSINGYDVWRSAIQQIEFKLAVSRIERSQIANP
jgi:lysophospholipase L1-like esterase